MQAATADSVDLLVLMLLALLRGLLTLSAVAVFVGVIFALAQQQQHA